MTTIQETVDQSLQQAGYGAYGEYAQPVVTALVNREQQIVGRLIEFAQGSDLDVSAVRNALADCGMHMPAEPQQPAQEQGGGDLSDVLGRIESALTQQNQTIQGLVGFARQNGYSG